MQMNMEKRVEKMQQEVTELDKKLLQSEQKKKQLESRYRKKENELRSKERKQRSHRLISIGAEVESVLGRQIPKEPELSLSEQETPLVSASTDHRPSPVQAITLLILIGKKQTQPIM